MYDLEGPAVAQAVSRVANDMFTIDKLWAGDTCPGHAWRHLDMIVKLSHVLFGEKPEDGDGRQHALALVLDVLLRPHFKMHPMHKFTEDDRLGALKQLQCAVAALEVVAGYKYVEPIDPADQIVQAQADLDGALFKLVRPEDCAEPLRSTTIECWVEKHTDLASKAVGAPESTDVDAAIMVNQMRETGAFLVPYAEMRAGQQLFWRQRAAGYDHAEIQGVNVLRG